VAACLSLQPELLTATAPVVHQAGFQSLFNRFAVHPSHHEDALRRLRLLHDRRDQTISSVSKIKVHMCSNGLVGGGSPAFRTLASTLDGLAELVEGQSSRSPRLALPSAGMIACLQECVSGWFSNFRIARLRNTSKATKPIRHRVSQRVRQGTLSGTTIVVTMAAA